MPVSHPWLLLGLAIAAEVLGTSFLKLSAGMTRPGPTLLVLPLGLTYAIWSGLGIMATVVVGVLAYRQIPTPGQLVGLALIVAGVVIVNLNGPA
jgi:small multidrug resistance pump